MYIRQWVTSIANLQKMHIVSQRRCISTSQSKGRFGESFSDLIARILDRIKEGDINTG